MHEGLRAALATTLLWPMYLLLAIHTASTPSLAFFGLVVMSGWWRVRIGPLTSSLWLGLAAASAGLSTLAVSVTTPRWLGAALGFAAAGGSFELLAFAPALEGTRPARVTTRHRVAAHALLLGTACVTVHSSPPLPWLLPAFALLIASTTWRLPRGLLTRRERRWLLWPLGALAYLLALAASLLAIDAWRPTRPLPLMRVLEDDVVGVVSVVFPVAAIALAFVALGHTLIARGTLRRAELLSRRGDEGAPTRASEADLNALDTQIFVRFPASAGVPSATFRARPSELRSELARQTFARAGLLALALAAFALRWIAVRPPYVPDTTDQMSEPTPHPERSDGTRPLL